MIAFCPIFRVLTMLRHKKMIVVWLITALTGLGFIQNSFAFIHIGRGLHHLPKNHLAGGIHPLKNRMGIPKIPASENPTPEIKESLQRMGKLYRMNNEVENHSSGLLTGMAIQHYRDKKNNTFPPTSTTN